MRYQFCPYCATPYQAENTHEFDATCHNCRKSVYENLVTTASAIIIQQQKLLLVRRALEPGKGMLDIPGGFCQPNEHPEAACHREVLEELGIEITITGLAGIFAPTPYLFQGYTQRNCDIFYFSEMKDSVTPIHPMDDVASVEWFPLEKLPQPEQLAFTSAQDLIFQLREKYPQHL